jgi:predicted secreted acid phosphatase
MIKPFAKRPLIIVAIIVATVFGHSQSFAVAAPPDALPNLTTVKNEIAAYYEGGKYSADVQAIEAQARVYLDRRVHAGVKRPALVLDIDDTSLSTYAYEKAHDFGFDNASWNVDATKGFPAIPATLALARHAAAEHIAIFFVTGRRTNQGALTRKNLLAAGFRVDGLYLRPLGDKAHSVVPFKSGARAAIEAKGYTILESIGDQQSDLSGGHAERTFKLPNPMYFLR